MIYFIILLAGGIASIFGPWWIASPLAVLVCLWKARTAKEAMLQSSLALFTLWTIYAALIHFRSGGILTQKMAGILTGTELSPETMNSAALIFGITGFISLFMGTLSGLAGYTMRPHK